MSEIEKGTLGPKEPTHIVDDKPPSDEGSEDEQRKDVAFSVYLQAREQTISLEEGNRVRRKIDLHLMPLMMVTGFLQYLDKSSMSYAVLYNLEKDLNMTGSQYSWASSLFFFGLLAWSYPSLLLLQRFPVGKYFACQVLAWGVISFLMATASNFAGLAALRFLLGAAESVQMPGFVIITSMYYTREEQPFRLIFWYATNGIAIIAGGLFAYGIGNINGTIPLWKYPFIICGALSTCWSIVLFLALPSNPATAWFLTPEERAIAISRVKSNQTGIENKTFRKEQAIEALLDPKVILSGLANGAGNILSGITLFGGLVIRGFGFTTLQTTLLQCPTGLIEIIALVVFTAGATYIPNSRVVLSIIATTIALAGTVMLYAVSLEHRWALVAGLWIMGGFMPASFILGMGVTASNIAGHTKKVTAHGIIFMFYATGSIVGPQLYTSAPYVQGRRANVVAMVICLALGILQLIYLIYENRKRRRFLELHPELQESDFLFRDLTDKENPFCTNKI
ncbi:major facilitator superfamily domain-containing protein [Aspergillus pseudodeflectus]|uniref:Major facilitator superfamily domain-containing protein n=1 Tax=Aspergillus pseudodeflectus TaxID=176178 RepID=A0ABR4JG65_9EURO